MSEPFITIALIRKTQGRHGEVAAQLFTDFPEKFSERKHLIASKPGAPTRELELEDFWPHKDLIVLKFAGIDSINAAELLIGYELQVPASERTQLDEGTFYISDLIGCAIFDVTTSRIIGLVSDVQLGAGEAPVLTVKDDTTEHLIPFVERFIQKTDLTAKRIEMLLPEGLLDL